jgi:hypothetical protein
MKNDWNPPAWLAPNNKYITGGYGYQFVVMAANARDSKWTPLYPKREWVGLTDEEIINWWESENGLEDCEMYKLFDFSMIVRAVQAKLKEKNT